VLTCFAGGTLLGVKLYRFDYSPYARKVQMTLDLCGLDYEIVDVPYGNREHLAELTGGYIAVPVLQDGDDVVTDSRRICERLATAHPETLVVDDATRGSVWAYADWCDSELEDVLFRLAVPDLRGRFATAWERSLFVYIKERRYGAGCVDTWLAERPSLMKKAQRMLDATRATLDARPFLFGAQPTLADATLYGQLMMLEVADELLPGRISPTFHAYMRRLEASAAKATE